MTSVPGSVCFFSSAVFGENQGYCYSLGVLVMQKFWHFLISLLGLTINANFDYRHYSITIVETTITILSLSWHTIMILSGFLNNDTKFYTPLSSCLHYLHPSHIQNVPRRRISHFYSEQSRKKTPFFYIGNEVEQCACSIRRNLATHTNNWNFAMLRWRILASKSTLEWKRFLQFCLRIVWKPDIFQ